MSHTRKLDNMLNSKSVVLGQRHHIIAMSSVLYINVCQISHKDIGKHFKMQQQNLSDNKINFITALNMYITFIKKVESIDLYYDNKLTFYFSSIY